MSWPRAQSSRALGGLAACGAGTTGPWALAPAGSVAPQTSGLETSSVCALFIYPEDPNIYLSALEENKAPPVLSPIGEPHNPQPRVLALIRMIRGAGALVKGKKHILALGSSH